MYRLKPLTPLLWLMGLFWCFSAFAQEKESNCLPGTDCRQEEEKCPPGANCPAKKKPQFTLSPETVTVTSGFQNGAVSLEPTKTVIDLTKFESSGSVDRVEDVLKHMTGIDVIQPTGGADPQQIVLMRGFDDSRFQVAINGRPMTGPTAGADTFVDWSSLTTQDIERIEIIRGSASARYENATGGVINIITKKGRKDASMVPKSSAEISYSSFNTLTSKASVSGGIGKLGYFINFGSRNSDGFLRNNYQNGNNYGGRLDYSFPWKGSVTASYRRSDLTLGYPIVNDPHARVYDPASPYYNPNIRPYDPDYPIVKEDSDTLRKGRLISYPSELGNAYSKSLKIKKKTQIDVGYDQPFGNSNLSVKYFMDRGSEDSWSWQLDGPAGKTLIENYQGDPFIPGAAGNDPPEDSMERNFGVMLDYQMNFWKKHSISVGYSHRRMATANTPDLYRLQGGYIEDQYAVTKKLTLNYGLRYELVREHTYAYKNPDEDQSTALSYRHTIFTKQWLPKFSVTYQFSPLSEVFASVNRDVHFPGC
jgi:outer membrane receptor protein involved in Fe transport